tara:strand:- start:547 stop:843 length:297 start_codon:yes stop_codon:yes gene_type:complete
MSPTQTWQQLAGTFHAIDLLTRYGKLPAEYKPEDAIYLYKEVPLSTHERNVIGFLLHVWNHYDFPFELSEVAGWDPRHQQAFIGWVTGKTLGRPMRYF